MEGLGLKDREIAGLESYKKGQWMKFKVNGGTYYGIFNRIHNGELLLSKITEIAPTEKGDELCIVEKEAGFLLSHVVSYRKSSRREAERTIENFSPYQNSFGKYVSLPCGSTTYCGKIAKLGYDTIDLLPCLNFRKGELYIEEETPVSVKTGNIQAVIPSSREDLEHKINEMKKQMEAAKPKVPVQQETKAELGKIEKCSAETTGLGT